MSDNNLKNNGSNKLDRYGKRGIIIGFIGLIIYLAILLLSAGSLTWINAWIYIGFSFLATMNYVLIMVRKNPQLLNERGKFMKEGTKDFDKVFYALWRPLGFAFLVIAGLDAVRYGWTTMAGWWLFIGLLIWIPGILISLWALAVNTHFEATVRIQEDRDHRVCLTGPYRYVRHPGYLGLILTTIGGPLILGSWWSFLPSALILVIVVLRTLLEDRMLRLELEGYKEYAEKTRFRLIPNII